MENNKILTEQVKSLPQELRDFIAKKTWLTNLEEISKKNNLVGDQVDLLENEVLFVLLGMESRNTLSENLRSNAGLTENRADAISKETYEKIIKEVEQFLPSEEEETKEEALKRLNTEETKEQARERLMRRELTTDPFDKLRTSNLQPTTLQKTAEPPANLPMVEPGEKVHEVSRQENTNPKSQITPKSSVAATGQANNVQIPKPEAEKPKLTQTPRYGYEPGKDPYREPLS